MKDFSDQSATESFVFFDQCVGVVSGVERILSSANFVSYLLNMLFVRLHVYIGYTIRSILRTTVEKVVFLHIKETDLISPVFTEN